METQQQERSDNELIAEFLGYERSREIWENDEHAYTMKHPSSVFNKWVIPSHMAFNKSWDWLMPVVEKINEVCKETGYPDGLEICQWHIISVASNIKLVYFSVIEFIKWYNSLAKQSKS